MYIRVVISIFNKTLVFLNLSIANKQNEMIQIEAVDLLITYVLL